MDLGRGKVSAKNGVVSGSVWDNRMKVDEVKGGVKVFNGEEKSEETNNKLQVYTRTRAKQGLIGVNGKRKTWKSEISQNPIQISNQKSELNKSLNVSADKIKKSPVGKLVTRSMSLKVSSEPSDGVDKNLVTLRKVKSELNKVPDEGNAELRNVKSEGNKGLVKYVNGNEKKENPKGLDNLDNETEKHSVESRREKNESFKASEGSTEEIENVPIENGEIRSEEICVCEDKVITSNVGEVKSPTNLGLSDDDDDDENFEEEWDEEVDEEIEAEMEVENKSVDVKEIDIQEHKPQKVVVIEEKKIHPSNGKPLPISPIVRKQQPAVVNHPRIIPKPTKTQSTPVSVGIHRVPKNHSKLQSLVDLVMWRDASRSTFIFGIGTFIIISSSYTRDLNISLITVVSYLGLVYLAAIYLFRSFICRGGIDIDDTSIYNVIGEEEALWLLKMILPYINESLLKLRALFSGDPATTMKLAVLLFVLARCGGSITIWKMAKLGFFGVFLVPKVCSSYSTQLTAYGTFWVRRFRDAWDSCSHKKAVAFAIFTLVWNFSSIIARIWAVFMLLVAFKYYQQSLISEDWVVEEEDEEEVEEEEKAKGSECFGKRQVAGYTQRHGTTSVELNKPNKA